MITDGGEAEHQNKFTGPPLGGGTGGDECRAEDEDVKEVDPGGTDGKVFVQMIDDNECADAECDIGGHIPETNCQKQGAENEDMRKGEDRMGAEHLLG